jgi:two-component system vancomycin resistance associated response regulator VraR
MEAVASVQRRKLLIVEDDPAMGRSLHRGTRGFFEPVIAASVKQAIEILESGLEVAGAVVDIGLPDGNGFDVVAAVRRLSDVLPVLVLTGSNDPVVINRAHALRVEFVCKPFFEDNLVQFVQRALSGKAPPPKDKVASTIAEIAAECRLSIRELELLKLAVEGIPRSHLAEVVGVSENTVKTQIRSLLDKCGQEALSGVVWWVRSRSSQ